MIGFFIAILSLPYLPHFAFLFLGIFVLVRDFKSFFYMSKNNYFSLIILIIFINGALINMLFHLSSHDSFEFPYFFLHIVTFIIAYSLRKNDIKVIVYFVLIEAFVGFLELAIGKTSILPFVESSNFELSIYWYNNRVMGLSPGISAYAANLFIAVILLERFKKIFKYKKIIKIILYIAIFLSFNRSVLVAIIFFELLLNTINLKNYLKKVLKTGKIKQIHIVLSAVIIIFLISGTIFLIFKYQILLFQFTRGSGHIELSGREVIWADFFAFIKDNLFFGNGSFKKIVPYHNISTAHAHNSFIQLLANHGIILSLLFLIIVFTRITKYNILYVSTIFVYSLSQYGIFWGISTLDILLFAFLFNDKLFKKPYFLETNN